MDRGQFIDIGEFDVESVDLDSAPRSAEHYLQQVIADRIRGPSYVSVTQPHVSTSNAESDTTSSRAAVRDPRAPPREWCQAKVADFSLQRSKMEKAPRRQALQLEWPNYEHILALSREPLEGLMHISNVEEWEELLLRRCHPKCVHFLPSFPNHQGTPPAVPVVLSLSSSMVNALIPYAVEWAECDEFSRGLREWIFALLLIVEMPLYPDVCAALRGLAKLCKTLRSSLDIERENEIRELSWFIAIVSEYFGQTDLSDS